MARPQVSMIARYRLSAADASAINSLRTNATAQGLLGQLANQGVIFHQGATVAQGDVCAFLITRVATQPSLESTPVDGQVVLNGNDVFWIQGVVQGDNPGQWWLDPRGS